MDKETSTIQWHEVDHEISGLPTEIDHQFQVQREAIPLVFVPGIMGSRLRLAGTDGKGKTGDLPNMRWDPSNTSFMLKFIGKSPAYRKQMVVGDAFSSSHLEVDNSDPVEDGFRGLMADYCDKFLTPHLKNHDWGPLRKVFEFPVYAFGYNWTDDNVNSGNLLAARIQEIIAEASAVTGLCEKVILITHSMGGLVARWASEGAGAQGSILGIVHGVQPVTGAPAAYWRIKAGFEWEGWSPINLASSAILGPSGPTVTPLLGNIPGGLELLPNKLHRANNGSAQWLTIKEDKRTVLSLPKSDPYDEIYRIKAIVKPTAGEKPSTNLYWGLVDPDLLDPGNANTHAPGPPDANDNNSLDADMPPGGDPWGQFLAMLDLAESFHDALGKNAHPLTWCLTGTGHHTADLIELRIESNWVRSDPYPTRGFRGFFTSAAGKSMQAVLQDPAGDGDGTVVRASAQALNAPGKPAPGDKSVKVAHQPAYENGDVKTFAGQAIIALCKLRYEEQRNPVGDFPTNTAAATTG